MQRNAVTAIVMTTAAILILGSNAWAVKPFHKEFESRYVDYESRDPTKQQFKQRFQIAKCAVCHTGTSKKERNIYGQAVARYLDKEKHQRNPQYIQAVLREVEKQKVDPTNPESATFGDYIRQGFLPAGN